MPNVKNQETLAKIKEDLDGVSAVWVVDYWLSANPAPA